MADYTREQLEQAIESARADNNPTAVQQLQDMLAQQGKTAGALPEGYTPGERSAEISAESDPLNWDSSALTPPASEEQISQQLGVRQDGPALRKPTQEQPWTKEEYAQAGEQQQKRERELAQSQYDADMELTRDPANRPNRQQQNEFISSNTNTRYGASMVNSMGQQMIVDPETGKVRWTAMSPETMDRIDKQGSTTGGVLGVLAGGSTRGTAASLQNKEAEIMKRNNFQQFLLTSDNGLPEQEQKRITDSLTERYGKDHRFVKNPGLAPANEVMALIKQNPDYEQEFDRIKGDEWWEERKEFGSRLLARAGSAWTHGAPLVGFGADDPRGALGGREAFQPEVRNPETGEVVVPGIQYDEGEVAPAYPGASMDLRNWKSDAEKSPSLYEHFILPMVGKKTGKTPAQIASEFTENVRKKFSDEEQEAEREYSLFKPGEEITLRKLLTEKEMWTHPESKVANPESLILQGIEQLPEMGATIGLTRNVGRYFSRKAAQGSYGLTASAMNTAREKAASRAGMLFGGGSEGLLVATHLENETREIMNQIPQEAWDKHAMYQALREGGLTPEASKQIIIQDASTKAATSAAVVTMITGAPMSSRFAKSAAGRLIDKSAATRLSVGAGGEMVQESGQEIMELMYTEAAVRPIDPDNPIYDDPNRYWETGLTAAITMGPIGMYGSMSPSTPVGVDKEHVDAARAAVKFKKATNERFRFEAHITDPEYVANSTPKDRLHDLRQLETLQRKESQAILDAEAPMRAFLLKQGPTKTAETEIKMLNRLVMRANAMKSDIAVAESKRTTAAELQEEERRVLSDRADLQRRVNESVIKLEDIERLSSSIESVQNMEAIGAEQEAELIKEGYAKLKKDGSIIILPKGKRATKELNRQARGLRSRIEGGYTGPERRGREGAVVREAVDAGGPQQREQLLYTDPLTEVQNRRAFNERQEHIDVKEGDTPNQIDNALPAVAAVDVDSMKWVNDNMTHAAGDRLLTAVSDVLNEQDGVEVYRMGGDEFAVAGQSQEAVEKALQAAAKKLAKTPIAAGNDEITPQITWGKGDNYEQADAQGVDMKRERIQRGVTAKRKGEPATYRVKSQKGLFQRGEVVSPDVEAQLDQMIADDALFSGSRSATAEFYDAADVLSEALGRRRPDAVRGTSEVKESGEYSQAGDFPASTSLADQVVELARTESARKIDSLKKVAGSRKARLKKIANMRIDGATNTEIANELDVSVGTVEREVKVAGLPNIRKLREAASVAEYANLFNQGKTRQEIATALGKTKDAVAKLRKKAKSRGLLDKNVRTGVSTPSEVRQQVVSMTNRGFTQRQIAEKLNLDRGNVGRVQKAYRLGMFAFDAELDPDAKLPGSWNQIRNKVKKGDIVEVLTPDGATFGLVRAMSRNRGRPRMYVSVQGKIFKFNPDKNWLIVDKFTKPADLAWITGDAEYAQPGRESFPQTLSDVGIGHIGNSDGDWYADLDQDYVDYSAPLPWYMDESQIYKQPARPVEFVPNLEPASTQDYIRALVEASRLALQFPNHPKINVVRDMQQLKAEAPHIIDQIRAELGGGTMRGVRGYMDHVNPENGIYVFVQNLDKTNFDQELTEVMVHEMVGHYGVRGAFGDELALREHVSELVDAFPRLADYYANRLTSAAGIGLDKSIPEHKQLIGEEMFAYIAGELESGQLVMNKKQKSVWRRFIDYIRGLLRRRNYIPISEEKAKFWNDSRVQQMLQRSQDFLKSEKDFKWRAAGGSTVHPFMRNANIFTSNVRVAVDSGKQKLSKGERKRRAKDQNVSVESIPEEMPLFPERGTPGQWQAAFDRAAKPIADGGLGLSKLELELTGLSRTGEWQFLRDVTYGDLQSLWADHINNGVIDTNWYRGVVPAPVAQELDGIYKAMDDMYMAGPLPRYGNENARPVRNKVSVELMRARIAEIMQQKINPKKTNISKDLMRAHLASDSSFDVYVEETGSNQGISLTEAQERVFGKLTPEEVDALTDEEMEQIKQEQVRTARLGYDIGYDEKQDRWFDYYNGSRQYSEFSPQGSRKGGDFRVVLIKTKGRQGGMTGQNQHYGPNIMHIRTGVSELLEGIDISGVTFPNPAMANRFLSLIELQSDHFQKLRKAFTSQIEKDRAERRQRELQGVMHSVARKFGTKVGEDMSKGIEELLLPIANLSDGSAGMELQGSLKGNMQRRSQEQFQRSWDQLSQEEKYQVWDAEKRVQLTDVLERLEGLTKKLRDHADRLEELKVVGGTLDARGFQRLDTWAGASFVSAAISDVHIATEFVRGLVDATNQPGIVHAINHKPAMSHIVNEFSRDRITHFRLSQAGYMLQRPLNDIYDLFTGDTGGVTDVLGATESRETATIRLPKAVIHNYLQARASEVNDEAAATVAEAIFASTNLVDVGIEGSAMSFNISVNGEYIDIDIVGGKADISKMKDKAQDLVGNFVTRFGQRQRDANVEKMLSRARRDQEGNATSGYDYDFLEDYLNLEEADVSGEGDNLTRDWDIQTYYSFEEDTRPEVESEKLEEAFNNVNWDEEADGEYSREGEEYLSHVVIDEDGEANTDAAERWLQEARNEYKYEVLTEQVMDDVYNEISRRWDAEGPSALVIGSLPSEWDEDGDASGHVEVRIMAKESGDAYDVFIDDEEVDYFTELTDAKNRLDKLISDWYISRGRGGDETPPFGQPYGPDSDTNDAAQATVEEAARLKDAAPVNWDMVTNTIVDAMSMISGKPLQTTALFNELVILQKKMQSYEVMPDHPLSKDELWRPIALKYLISDAVRRGMGGIVWNQGLASASRGGIVYEGEAIADQSDITSVERFTWTKEQMSIRGKVQEVFVIRSPELKRPMVVARDKMIPVLGIDATQQINLQDKGKIPIPALPERPSDNVDVDPTSQYVISTTEEGTTQAVHRRADNRWVGFARSDEELAWLINNDQDSLGTNQQASTDPVGTGVAPIGDAILSQGLVRKEDTGGNLFIIVGRGSNRYSDTFAVPKLAGARQSYEEMLVRFWNKELKKYGTYIQETYVKIDNSQEAYRREGQPALVDADIRNTRIEDQHGVIEVKELTGGNHGWAIISEKQGPVTDTVYDSRKEADQILAEFLERNYPLDKRGVKTFFIPINDQMREEFSGPVAPFAYDPDRDPALKEFRSNIGRRGKKSLWHRFSEWRVGWKDRETQGNLDKFYGLRKALIDAELSEDPYIDARLSTSLDSLMKGVIEYGWPVWKEGIVQNEGMSMKEVFASVMNDPDVWSDFMVGNRAKRLMLEGWDAMVVNADGDVGTTHVVREVRELLPIFSGETEAEQVWDMLVKWDRGEVGQTIGAVRYDSFTEAELDGLSQKERQYLMHILGTTHWRKKKKGGKPDLEFGHRWRIFDWRVANRQQSKRRKETGYEGQREAGVASKWQYTIDEMVERFDFKNEAEARASANKLTEIALKKQEQHDKATKVIINKGGKVNSIVHKFGLTVKEAGREKTFKPAGIEAAIRLGDKFPHLKTVAENWAVFNKHMLDFCEEAGTINSETRPLWENADWVPFLRVVDDRLIGPSNKEVGIANQRSPIRRLSGKEGPIGDVLTNIFMATTNMMDSAVKNYAATNAVDALLGTGTIVKVGYDWKAHMIPASQLKALLEKAGIPLNNIPPETFEGMRKMFAPQAPSGKGYMSILRNGKPEYYYTDNNLLYRSMTAINIERLDNLFPWIGVLTGPKRLFTDWITIDPGFVARNLVRDTANAFVISRDMVVPIGGALSGFAEALVESETMQILTGAGAAFENGYLTQHDPNATKRLLRRVTKDQNISNTVLDSPFKLYRAWRHVTSASENANRIAIYHAAIRAGKSKKQAVFEAKDSMDFSMGGDYGHIRFIVATVPFMNARMQGLYRLGKAAHENPKAFAIKGAILGLAGWVLYMQFRDDERYKDLEMWDRHSYHHFWIGEEHYRMPKAFEVGAIFNTIPEMFTEAYLSDASDADIELLRGFAHMMGQTFAMNIVPHAVMPIVEMGFNYDTFRQRPITSFYQEQRMPPEQYSYTTSPSMIELARALPQGMDAFGLGKLRSPKHLEHLYLGYTGTFGKYMLMAADAVTRSMMDYPLPPKWEAQDWPVRGSFDRGDNPPRRTKYEREVYRLLDKVTAVQGSLRFLETTKQRERYVETKAEELPYIKIGKPLEKAREAIQDLNKAIMQISIYQPTPDEDARGEVRYTPEQKQQRIDELEKRRNTIFRKAYELRPGGKLNPDGEADVTMEDVIDLIDNFGVDDSVAYQMRLKEESPVTAELLRMIDEDLSGTALQTLAKTGGT